MTATRRVARKPPAIVCPCGCGEVVEIERRDGVWWTHIALDVAWLESRFCETCGWTEVARCPAYVAAP